ncbi:hypothetical protein AQUCO_00500575v1 [Aquilegia coerulea]|uniref:FBD domain-containing protein n=1 Tax=Aquilegia coerulea TaxID=218851 RepID=A0A2G5ESJ6_AQUCA|nr:hypothetical protein AQUCO_00500575v1 [Aquilegia coerulea]
MKPEKDHVKVLALLLRSFPNLQTLHISFQIKEESPNISNIKNYQQSQELSTGYLLTDLKTIEIDNFEVSDQYELHIVRYLLDISNTLEKMNIAYFHNIRESLRIRLSVSDLLLTFAKASPRAAVTFT